MSVLRYHMKRCVESGLWKPAADDPNTNPEDGFKRRDQQDANDDGDDGGEAPVRQGGSAEEPIYQQIDGGDGPKEA